MVEFTVSIRPRYGEVDSMGVVYHAHFLTYFDVGRTEYMRAHGVPYAALEKRGYLLAVTEAAVQYHRPARYDEVLSLAVWPSRVSGAGVTFAYELRGPDQAVLASGHTRLACLCRDTWHPTRLPEEARHALQRGRRDTAVSSKAS